MLSEKQDCDLKKEEDIDPAAAAQIVVDLEQAVRKLLKIVCRGDDEVDEVMGVLE